MARQNAAPVASPRAGDHDNPMRVERDRFVAFAFCRSDILVELDARRRVVFAAGATQCLGGAPEALAGRDIVTLIADADQPRVLELLTEMTVGRRPEPQTLQARGGMALSFTGYCVAQLDGHFYLSFQVATPSAAAIERERPAKPSQAKSSRGFNKLVVDALSESTIGDGDQRLTLLDLENMPRLLKRLTPEQRELLLGSIDDNLRGEPGDSRAVTHFAEGRYGMLHGPDLDVSRLSSRIAKETKVADPEGIGVMVQNATVALAEIGLEGQGAADALIYSIRRFARSSGSGFSLKDLASDFPRVMSELQKEILQIRGTIESRAFSMAFQPIVCLQSRQVHHYEVLARLLRDTNGSPQDFILKAEDLNLISEFDMAMTQTAIEWLKRQKSLGRSHSIAVNLSAQSLGNAGFVAGLQDLLEQNRGGCERLLFEITESAKIPDPVATNRALQSLRLAGHKVCLDDFGVGETSLRYLRQFDVDFVKIDGSYVRAAMTQKASLHILKAIAKLCRDLGIATVAEMIDDENMVAMLRSCGVDYGQGYLFGKPAREAEAFEQG